MALAMALGLGASSVMADGTQDAIDGQGAGAPDGDAVAQCLSCHVGTDGRLDIVGLTAMRALPPEWPLFYEDAYDLDGDGIAGRVQHVSGGGRPLVALYGRKLAAARLTDFARIAGAAHGIDAEAEMDAILASFLDASPDPDPFTQDQIAAFEARGCASCHVTDGYEDGGRTYRPLSDFLLHDLGAGPVRTAPLWGCGDCLTAPEHGSDGGVSRN